MAEPRILKVAVSVPLSRLFDYLPPEGVQDVTPGSRVRIPFGRQKRVGVVMATGHSSDLPAGKLRACLSLVDASSILSAEDLRLITFASQYYHHPIGEVVAAALPSALRAGKPLLEVQRWLATSDEGRRTDPQKLARRAPRQAELLALLCDTGTEGMPVTALAERLPNWRHAAKALQDKGLIVSAETDAMPEQAVGAHAAVEGPALNDDQQAAFDTLQAQSGFAASLLDGVTGSGKTEVYLSLIRETLAAEQQALVLVPEIGLTPQLVNRLRQRLGVEPAVLHSALSDNERLGAWRAAQQGAASLIVGTRSAVFTPAPRLGLIVVDEEHDHSLKQQEGLRYSARDLAIVRARNRDIRVVLGSATPTLETLQHCLSGQFTRLRLPVRAGGAKPPTLRLIDLSRTAGSEGLSEQLAAAIERHLEKEGQVLMFLNRRGFAPTLICSNCGHIAECGRCDSRMTVHARDMTLRCHHCGSQGPIPAACPECRSALRPLGEGTERLEDALLARFPDYEVQRIDSDSTQRRGSMEAALARAEQGHADILVGTQMLSKGHHFPRLTLVGIINADQGLFGSDFRSAERLAQSIVQVAGRAGRETRRGEVLIQTAFPKHPFWPSLIEGGYSQVASEALAEREQSGWPPFTRLALLRSAAHRQDDAFRFLHRAAGIVRPQQSRALRLLGPVEAPMARKAGRYRAQLLIQSSDRKSLHACLAALRPALEAEPSGRKVRWSIDVDPIELF